MAASQRFVDNPSTRDGIRINGADAVERIRLWLTDSGYAESATRAMSEGASDDGAAAKSAAELPIVRLLLGGSSLALAEAETLFAPDDLEDWVDAGLFAIVEKRVRPLVQITPYRKLLVVSDCERIMEAGSRADVVTSPASCSNWLADFTIRREYEYTLDLNTGTGVQAMLAAEHSQQVVATDTNPRALEFARFNAALNGIDNIEFVEGGGFEAVEGRVFDLILGDSQRTMSPAADRLDRDKPLDEDTFVKQIIQKVPSFLSDGGYAQILGRWVQLTGESWTSRLAGWLKPTGCNAWVVRGQSFSPAEYSRTRFVGRDTSDVEGPFGEWKSYCEDHNIESIEDGLITMQRSSRRPNWLRNDVKPPKIFPDAGAHVARCFWLREFLDRVSGTEILNEALYLSPSVELTQTSKPTITGWKQQSCQLTMTRGVAYSVTLDPTIARVVIACKSPQQLGRVLQAVAIANGENLNVVVKRYIGALRRLVLLGFLWPVQLGRDQRSVIETSEPDQAAQEERSHAGHLSIAVADAQEYDGKEARSA